MSSVGGGWLLLKKQAKRGGERKGNGNKIEVDRSVFEGLAVAGGLGKTEASDHKVRVRGKTKW